MARRTHVRDYVRSRHGTADHGGHVSEHERGYEAGTGLRSVSSLTKTDTYSAEDLETDLDWFSGLGIDSDTATSYIKFLLNSKPSLELKTKFGD